jgi:uncharacterized membrane protein
MNSHVKFFFGLLFPMFVMVGLVRIAMNDMVVMASLWSIWTLVFTVAGAVAGTILETTLKPKPTKKYGEK